MTDHEPLFRVRSPVDQLRPEVLVQQVVEAEEAQWSSPSPHSPPPHSPPSSSSSSSSSFLSDTHHPGLALLRHGTSVKKIHSYFSQLEFRKCCLHLAGRHTTSHTMRVVQSSSTIDDGSAKKPKAAQTYVTHLEEKELRAFKHAYLCTAYPVLAVPDPPSPFSPSPVHPATASTSPTRGEGVRKWSPYSLHDSGMEEAEDLAFIPSESLCSHLQRAFQLSDDKFRHYRHLINKTYVRKSAQKLLAEELTGQLAVLENNCHPFYRPQDFLPPLGYELWRKAEYSHITELLGKFWQLSLPFPRHTQDLMAELHTVHHDYRLLLLKLLSYERDFHQQAEEEGGSLASPLSTASIRLLREFGLRYGVGEVYRRVLYLDQLTQDFSPSLTYLRHLLAVLTATADLMPPSRRALAIVKTEYDMLMGSLLRLTSQVTKALEQMKSLFPGNKPPGAVELLVSLLQKGRDLRVYLQANSLQPLPSLTVTLTDIVQGMFFQTYERCKTVIRTELRHSRDIHVCPRMLNALIMEVRQEVTDCKNNFQIVFSQYFDLTMLAARAFYSLLMKDMVTLCQQEILRDSAIDLRMLALIHRLNQLDQDWSAFITPTDQAWRVLFQPHMAQWGVALRLHIQDLVMDTIAGDAFVTQQLQLPSEYSPPVSLTSLSCSPHTLRSFSLTPSVNSAFSLPRASRQNSMTDSTPSSQGSVPFPPSTTASSHPPGSQDFLSFTDRQRHCASVPVFCERPAMVRVMSEARMARPPAACPSLHTVHAVEDLTRAGGAHAASSLTQLLGDGQALEGGREGVRTEASPPVDQPPSHFLPLHDDEETGGYVDRVDNPSDSDQDSECDSDSADEAFTFPPLADVTDLSVSNASLACKEPAPAPTSAQGRSEVKRRDSSGKASMVRISLQADEGVRKGRAAVQGHGHHVKVSKQNGREWKGEVPVAGQGHRGRSCSPHIKQQQAGVASVTESIPHTLHPVQVSAQRKPSTVSVGTTGSVVGESDPPLLQSVQSTLSFPTPQPGQPVVIPVSGSTVDLLVLLQRTLGFGHSLCQAVFPPHFHHAAAAATARCRGAEGGEGVKVGGQGAGVEEEEEVASLRSALHTFQNTAHLNIVQALCEVIGVYADNMLCLDLCAVPKNIAKRVIGQSLVEHAIGQQQQHKVWGCRHQLQGLQTCTAFHNRKAAYLSDRYEPITQKMCVRINNVMVCQSFLDWCDKQTQAAHLHCPHCGHAPHDIPDGMDGPDEGRARSDPSAQCSDPHAPTGGAGDCRGSHPGCGNGRGLKQQWLGQTATHLMAVWTALCRLLAFRINLFLHDGLTLLLTLKAPDVSIATCLSPLTVFLRSHLDALSSWLYRRSFRRVIDFLWIFIVQDIEEEVGRLFLEKGSKLSPHLLLQTLMHLMKFMNNSEKGITRELLLSQAEGVMTKLQLWTLSSLQLMALYQNLMDRYTAGDGTPRGGQGEDGGGGTRPGVPLTALHRLHHDLQDRQKCFSGAQLTLWIRHHPHLLLPPDQLSLSRDLASLTKERALTIAQHLLDTQVIVDLETWNSVHSDTSSIVEQQYPEVSLLDSLHSSQTSIGYHDDSDDSSTPTPQPCEAEHQRQDLAAATSSSTTPQLSDTPCTTQPAPSIITHCPSQPPADDGVTRGSDDVTRASDGVTRGSDDVTRGSDDVTRGSDDVTRGSVPQPPDDDDITRDTDDVTRDTDDVTRETDVTGDTDDVTRGSNDVTRGSDDVTRGSVPQPPDDDDITRDTDDVTRDTDDVTRETDVTGDTDDVTRGSVPQPPEYDVVTRDADDVTRETDDVTRDTDDVTRDTDDVTRGSVPQPPDHDDIIRYTDDVTRDTEDVIRDTDDVTRDTRDIDDVTRDTRDIDDVTRDTRDTDYVTRDTDDITRGFVPQPSDDVTRDNDDVTRDNDDVTRDTRDTDYVTRDTDYITRGSVPQPSFYVTRDDNDVTRDTDDVTRVTDDVTRVTDDVTRGDPENCGVGGQGGDVPQPPHLFEGAPGMCGPQRSPLVATLSAQVSSTSGVPPRYCHTHPQAGGEGEGLVNDLDMTSIGGTPLSFHSTSSFPSITTLFDSSPDRFYLMPSSPALLLLPPPDRRAPHPLTSPLDRSLQKLQHCDETAGLAHKCLMLKISPLFLLMLLYTRRKTDTLAASFLQQLPPSLLQHLSSGVEARRAECSVL
ncbi:uncharacterized protein LOC143293368 [Babylonia areolata]|uniref:uncharacterized protein LOC143293368 n=1 Tax=Babylonia areolata TaxID=304850 RepID=UPI003FD0909F